MPPGDRSLDLLKTLLRNLSRFRSGRLSAFMMVVLPGKLIQGYKRGDKGINRRKIRVEKLILDETEEGKLP